MFTSHPTLLIGPADWDATRIPQAEFSRRIDALWQAAPDAARALVYGDAAHHAELVYLTNLTPKLEASVALFARGEPPRLFVGGGPNMLGAARPLTFIPDMLPLQRLGAAIKDGTGAALLINAGNMAMLLRGTITEALGEGASAQDAMAQLWGLMRRKSAAELAVIRGACGALRAAMTAVALAQHGGAPAATAVLAGERAANEAGAQDVRTLFSLDGGRTLTPFTALVPRVIDPLQVYLAVRCFNYWAEGFALLSAQPSAVSRRAHDLLQSALAAAKARTHTRAFAQGVDARDPYRAHPVTERAFAAPIGLALEEPPYTAVPEVFEAGEVYSLRIGLTDGADQHAIVSAMIAVGEKGNEMLWTNGAG